MNKTLLALLLAAATSLSGAQTTGTQLNGTGVLAGLALSGTVSGALPARARVGVFAIDSSGAPVAELSSVPVNGGRFTLEIPSVLPPQRALSQLRVDSIFWPGVLEPVSVTGQVSVAELRFYVYQDANGNGRRDDTEMLQEATPFVGKAVLFVSFASGAAQVNAARGFQANLKAGWNGLLIEVGRAVKVTSSSRITDVSLNVQR